MARDVIVPKAEEMILHDEELMVLAELAVEERYMIVLKRVARTFADNMAKASFRLKAEDPNFAIKHTRYFEQAVGMKILIDLIEGSRKKVDEKER